jgi:threonine/homoserine/homoserine lactone efflux protein
VSITQLVGFGGVVVVAAVAPGPDFVVVMRNSVLLGRRAGMVCAVGIGTGLFLWSMVTALGIAGLLAASAVAYTVVKLAGAGYLVLLGARALLAARRAGYSEQHALPGPAAHGLAAALRQGLLTNLLNPKAAVFFLALMPQFLPADPAATDTALLGAIAATISALWFCVLANLVGSMRRLLGRASVRRTIDAVMGTLLVALGIRIAIQPT